MRKRQDEASYQRHHPCSTSAPHPIQYMCLHTNEKVKLVRNDDQLPLLIEQKSSDIPQ